jgi:MOSC domain-containing protein YiiM
MNDIKTEKQDLETTHQSTEQLQAGLADALQSPAAAGRLEAICLRSSVGERQSPQQAQLTIEGGVEGDRWKSSGASAELQVTLMNARVLDLVAGGDRQRWGAAGDQLIVDLDLSRENTPGGQRLQIDDVILEVSEEPHTGCAKFTERFGTDASRFIGATESAHLNLRGLNARIVQSGTVKVGSEIRKI